MNPLPERLDAWLAGLRSQSPSPDQAQTADNREGQVVRQLFLDRVNSRGSGQVPALSADDQVEKHWIAILHKARQEGLFAIRDQPEPSPWWRRLLGDDRNNDRSLVQRRAANQRRYAVAASAAIIAFGIVLVQMRQPTVPEEGSEVIFRGDETAQRIVVTKSQVLGLADQIEDALKKHQVPYRRTAVGVAVVQIQAQVPQGEAVRRVLGELGIVVPEHGRLNLLVLAE